MPVLSAIVNYWRGSSSPSAAERAIPYPETHQEEACTVVHTEIDVQENMKTRNGHYTKDDDVRDTVSPELAVSKNSDSGLGTADMGEEKTAVADSNILNSTSYERNELPHEANGDSCVPVDDNEMNQVTDAMEEEERAIHEETSKEQQQIVEQAEKEWNSLEDKQRYLRLQHLLQKSSIYCQFLLDKMENQKIEAAKKNERLSKKLEKDQQEESSKIQQVPWGEGGATRRSQRTRKETPSGTETPGKETSQKARKGKRRKADDSSYMISKYIDKESLGKRQKLSEEGSWKHNTNIGSSGSLQCVSDVNDDQVEEKMDHCKNSSQETQPQSLSTAQPKYLSGGSLRPYQLHGLAWLQVLYENGMNGILADEMGLGKTIQCIAMVAHLVEMGVRGPFLVAAPLSTLPNWVSEFNKFAPKIPVVLYHGSIEDRLRLRYKLTKLRMVEEDLYTYPVVITSYEICMRDRKNMHYLNWKYLVVDEGHRIKNMNCRLIRELKTYHTANRLLLTGTPLQNNLSELWSLLNFLLPDIFDDLESFQKWFDFSAINEENGNQRIIAQEREHQVLQRLHAILTPFLLRRLKADVELSLPPKKEVLVYAPLTKKQELFYKATLDRTIVNMLKGKEEERRPVELSSSGRVKRKGRTDINYKMFFSDKLNNEELLEYSAQQNEMSMMSTNGCKIAPTAFLSLQMRNILMQLRKCCNHPYLLECPLDPATLVCRVDEELVTSSGKMMLLDSLLPALKQGRHKVLVFSQMTRMMDFLEEYCILRNFGYSRLDGNMSVKERQLEMEKFDNDPNTFLFLLSTRAGGLGINLAKADTVIIYDSDWNPQVDLQAQDRCHRIGQTRPVVVYRLVTANTVDQRIVERASTKRKLEKMVIHKGKFKGRQDTSTLDVKELQDLLESGDHDKIVSSDRLKISGDELKALLDRSDLLPYDQKRQPKRSKLAKTSSRLFKVLESSEKP